MSSDQPPSDSNHVRNRWREVQSVLNLVQQLRSAGQTPDLREVERQHAHLMPELRAGLELLPADAPGEVGIRGVGSSPAARSLAGDPVAQILRQQLARYELQSCIGFGAQGVVYRATTRASGEPVAIKVMNPARLSSDRNRKRFLLELKVASHLEHPSIVAVTEHGLVEGRPYFVMPYIDGTSIDEYMELFAPPIRLRVQMVAQICRAIAHAHRRGVIHGDLKPSNLMIDLDGHPWVIDFGLATIRSEWDDDFDETGEQPRLASQVFLSPEQVGDGPIRVETRSDVYSIGVILYATVSGGSPYDVAGSSAAVKRAILNDPPRRIRDTIRQREGAYSPRFPAGIVDLEAIIFKALEKDPNRRYETCAAFADDLEQYLAGDVITARSTHRWYLARKFMRRQRMAIALFVVLLASGGLFWSRYELAREREQLIVERDLAMEDSRQSMVSATGAGAVFIAPEQLNDMSRADRAAYFAWMDLPTLPFAELDIGGLAEGPMFFFLRLRARDDTAEGAVRWLTANDALLDDLRDRLLVHRVTFSARPAPVPVPSKDTPLFEAGRVGTALAARALMRVRDGEVITDEILSDLDAARQLAYALEQGMTFPHYQQALSIRAYVQVALLEAAADSRLSEGLQAFILSDVDAASMDAAWINQQRVRMPFIRRAASVDVPEKARVDLHKLDKLLDGFLTDMTEEYGGSLTGRPTIYEVESSIDDLTGRSRSWSDLSLAQVEAQHAEWEPQFQAARRKNPILYFYHSQLSVVRTRTQVVATRRLLRLAAFLEQHRTAHGDWPVTPAEAVPSFATVCLEDPITGAPFVVEADQAKLIIRSAPISNESCFEQAVRWFKEVSPSSSSRQVEYLRLTPDRT